MRLMNFKRLKCNHKHNQLLWLVYEYCASLSYDKNFASVSYKSLRYLKNIEWAVCVKKEIPHWWIFLSMLYSVFRLIS
jgi:hypothetical protein